MTIFQAFILGIIQGITEFLPVSSTAHLSIVPWLMGWEVDSDLVLIFDVLVQWGTLLAVVVYFRNELILLVRAGINSLRKQSLAVEHARLTWMLVLATIPGAVAGLILKKIVAASLEEPLIIGVFLMGTAFLLFLSDIVGRKARNLEDMSWGDALIIGLAQVVSLFPGASRSGWTLGAGLLRGLDRVSATRFSFLMSIPILLGAGLVELVDLIREPLFLNYLLVVGVGFVGAAIMGFLAIAWFLRYLKHHSLKIFSVYCAVVGLFIIIVQVWRGI
jgi:undecaprenyl-diphosphatase